MTTFSHSGLRPRSHELVVSAPAGRHHNDGGTYRKPATQTMPLLTDLPSIGNVAFFSSPNLPVFLKCPAEDGDNELSPRIMEPAALHGAGADKVRWKCRPGRMGQCRMTRS